MEGFQVLIVDDEVHAIRGVEAGVRWDKLNISAVHTAKSLKQAQEVFHSHQIDLLLTDIDMPRGSGIDLLKWVRENYPNTEAVFLTAHADFSYAKQAIQLNSLNYLLKPVDYEELEEVIKNALEKISENKELNMVEKSYLNLQETHQSFLGDRFWLDLMNQVIPSTKDGIKQYLKHRKLCIDDKINYLPILIHVQRWRKGLTVEEERIMEAALKNAVIEEIAKKDKDVAAIELTTGYLLLVLPEGNYPNVHTLIKRNESFISEFKLYFECDLCCYVGEQARIDKILNMVQALKDAEIDNVTKINQVIEVNYGRGGQSTVLQLPTAEWLELMKNGSKGKLINNVSDYIDSWEKNNLTITSQSLHFFYQEFLQMLFYVLQIKGMKASEVFSQNLFTGNKEIFKSVSTLKEWILFISDIAMDQLDENHKDNSLVENVQQFIKENISTKKLTRSEIADHVHFNPDYLARVFKRDTGMLISDYLQQERIEVAKRMLIHTKMSVSDIAIEVGYSNYSYFSTVFKRLTQLSPIEYRRESSERVER